MRISESTASHGVTDDSSRRWFESLSPVHGQLLRVFCFPYAGGNVNAFRSWQRHFPSEIGLCLVHLPGRGRRISEQPFTRLQSLVETIADLIVREPQPPYVLFGHSMGALISFELSRDLRRRGFTLPLRLFLSGRSAPTAPKRESPIFNLPHEAFIAEVKKLNGTPKELLEDREALELFLPTLRADFEMVDTYEYHSEERLSCPITVYGGLADKDTPVESLSAWGEQTSAGYNVRMFAGDHFFIDKPGANFVDAFRSDVLSTLHHPVQEV